jgi:tRNA (adenine22-N1)-methyltransferase
MVKLSKRLNSLVKYVYEGDIVMDVGCDHALLDIYLVQNGILNSAYVCDVNANALQNGINNERSR